MIIAPLIQRAAELTGYTPAQIRGEQRTQHLARVRWCIFWLAYQRGLSLKAIARAVGKRDHTTVLHGVRQFKNAMLRGEPWTRLAGRLTGAEQQAPQVQYFACGNSTIPPRLQSHVLTQASK